MKNTTLKGMPDAWNSHVWFDNGEVASASRGSLLCKTRLAVAVAFSTAVFGLFAEDAYIEGTGMQAMILDALPGPNTRIEADYQFTDPVPQSKVWGLESYDSSIASHCMINNSTNIYWGCGDKWIAVDSKVRADTQRHTAIMDDYNHKLAIVTGGVTNWSVTTTHATTKTALQGIAVFGVNSSGQLYSYIVTGGVKGKVFSKMRLYGLRIYEKGVLTHNYRPWKSAVGAFTGLKDLCTGQLFVNQLDDSQFLTGGDISSEPAWDQPGTAPTITPLTPPASGDWQISVPSRRTYFMEGITTTVQRVVKTGSGTLMLGDANSFGSDVIISNGVLEADWVASGLSLIHIHVAGAKNSLPAFFSPRSSSFTAPLASTGAGTIAFTMYGGIKPATPDLKLNFFGDGREIVKGSAAFNPNEFDLGNSHEYALTFENSVSHNGISVVFKNSMANNVKPVYMTGRVSNNSTSAGAFLYYDGPFWFLGQEGRTDWQSYEAKINCGSVNYSNVTFYTTRDFHVGADFNSTTPAHVYMKDCTKTGVNSWDYLNGPVGSSWTLDGTRWEQSNKFNNGSWGTANKAGTLILTNNAELIVGTYRQSSGTTEQYSGKLSLTLTGDNGVARIGGAVGVDVKNDGCRDSVYNLRGGSVYLRDNMDIQIGSTHKGTLNQTGGDLSANSWVVVGWHAASEGLYNMRGGTFTRRNATHSAQDMIVGENGTGTVVVAESGRFVGCSSVGVKVASAGTSKGTFRISNGGEVTTARFYGGDGTGGAAVIFNGGILKGLMARTDYFSNLKGVLGMTAEGGAFDTNGKGDFAFGKTITAYGTTGSCGDTMTHQWRFAEGTLNDKASNVTASKVGSVSFTDDGVCLTGGKSGTSQLKLATSVLPTDGRGWTYEMWFKLTNKKNNYARLMQCGLTKNNKSFFISANSGGSGTTSWYLGFAGGENRKPTPSYPLPEGKWLHLAVTLRPVASGAWTMRAAFRDPETGAMLSEGSFTSPTDWKPSIVQQSDGLWIGNGAWGDPDPALVCSGVTIHDYAVPDNLLTASAKNGGWTALVKRGANNLTLTGANNYVCGTEVAEGTLTLASGATLPQTETRVNAGAALDLGGATLTTPILSGAGTVKNGTVNATKVFPGGDGTIGTLTLEGATLSGTVKMDVASGGSSDCLASSGALDVSGLTIDLADASALDKNASYTLLSAASLTGTPTVCGLPRRWQVVAKDGRLTLERLHGFIISVR